MTSIKKFVYRDFSIGSQREAEREYTLFAAEVQKGTVAYTGKYKLADFARVLQVLCKR